MGPFTGRKKRLFRQGRIEAVEIESTAAPLDVEQNREWDNF